MTVDGVELASLHNSQRLVTIDTNTAQTTVVGVLDESDSLIGPIVFTEDGNLIGSGKYKLFELNTDGEILRYFSIAGATGNSAIGPSEMKLLLL